MVGDGINYAALEEATVGIAMGDQVALESADMALTTDNLMKIVEAIEISNKACVSSCSISGERSSWTLSVCPSRFFKFSPRSPLH